MTIRTTDPYKLRQRMADKAKELGFIEFGVAEATALDEEAMHLREYLDFQYHASMQWMVRNVQRRTDPREVVPGAKSVIMVAYNYYTGRAPEDPGTAKISNYAWGDDYHDVITPKVRELETYLHEIAADEVQSRSYVDTGPIMEKAWAARAGIGWIGKHTNLIHRDHGSWFFLGAIIADMVLEYDAPIQDYCGSCSLCIDACPTDAIVEEYVLDSRKCISFLTIENREDSIPRESAEGLHGWIFGCDICQNVCPWNNRFEHTTDDPHFAPREENVGKKLEKWLDLTEAHYRKRFKKSPVKRAKYRGLQRNVRAALQREEALS